MSGLPTRSTQVLVVGAGPVGLFGALCAARHGLDVLILDQSWQGFGPGHAAILHPRSVRLLREEGIGEDVFSAGQRIENVSVYVDKKLVAELPLPSPAITLAQARLEEALLTALRERGVKPLEPYQATTIEQYDDGAQVCVMRRELVRRGSPANYSEWEPVESSNVLAQFVIGADGYDSRVRAALGIEAVTVGKTESFAIFESSSSSAAHGIELYLQDGLDGAFLPLANGRARWSFQIASDLDALPEAERLRKLVSERAPRREEPAVSVDWGSVMHFERRLARSFGKGRVWLAGDSAHVTSPFGGQSMNGGLFEAHELACRISEVVKGRASLDGLENYGHERKREWHKLLGVNVNFDLLPQAPAWVRSHARRIVPSLPVSGRDLELTLKQIGLRIH